MDRNRRSPATIFPPIEPYAGGMLRLDARHTMYWEESGNPQRRPVLFLHGGPGAGATPVHRRFFDPAPLAHRHLRPARRRAIDAARRGPRQFARSISSTTSSGCAANLGIARLAPVRRLLGLDLGAALRRDASRAGLGADPARHLPVPRERDRLVPLRHADGLPGGVAQLSSGFCRRPSAAICWAPITAG